MASSDKKSSSVPEARENLTQALQNLGTELKVALNPARVVQNHPIAATAAAALAGFVGAVELSQRKHGPVTSAETHPVAAPAAKASWAMALAPWLLSLAKDTFTPAISQFVAQVMERFQAPAESSLVPEGETGKEFYASELYS